LTGPKVKRAKVLLIGWDAADWKVIHPLIAAGKMPNVARFIQHGATGRITTLHPPLSPMLWTSVATGKRPFRHGIHGFFEPTRDARGVQPITNLSRKTKAIWNILNQNHLRSVVLGWWPSHPAEPIDGVMVSDHFHRVESPLDGGWPVLPNSVHPPELAWTLAGLRMHPDLLTPAMVEPFIPLAREIDQDTDLRLSDFLRMLAECMSVQSAALWLLEREPWDFFAVYFDSIDHFSHAFMRYHPPRQAWIPERDFELYSNVVSTAYQFHDRALGELLNKAGEDATVILMSDHGFHPDHLRPSVIPAIPAGPAVEHRDLGILAMNGAGIRCNQGVQGASVLDIAPTILTLFGLPVGQDMDGKVLTQALAADFEPAFIPSWDEVDGPDGRHPSHAQFDPIGAHEAMEQMIALGYVDRPDANVDQAITKTIRELRCNLGESFQDAARHAEAREIFAELHAADPAELRFAMRLFVSCRALDLLEEMRRIADCFPAVEYFQTQLFIATERYDEAFNNLDAGSLEAAELHLRKRRWNEAKAICERILAHDPDNPHAYAGLSRAALGQRRYRLAARHALDALDRLHHFPQAHFLLGRALAGLGQFERAAEAYRAALALNPNFPEAHKRLATLLAKHLSSEDSARAHWNLARTMTNKP
jgi:hypothetical protein